MESSELVGTQTILVEEPDKTDPSNEPAEPSEPETPEEPEAPEAPTEEVTAPTAAGETDFSISYLELFDDGTEEGSSGDTFFVYFTAEEQA